MTVELVKKRENEDEDALVFSINHKVAPPVQRMWGGSKRNLVYVSKIGESLMVLSTNDNDQDF